MDIYAKNKDGRLSYFRKYYQKNRDKILETANKKYRDKVIAKMHQDNSPKISGINVSKENRHRIS